MTQAILVERDYKGQYERFALTPEEFKQEFPDTVSNVMWPITEAGTDTIQPMVHIWFTPCVVGDAAWIRHFTNMEWGLPESDIVSGNLAYVREDLMGELKAYIPQPESQIPEAGHGQESPINASKRYKVTLESMCDGESQVCMWVEAADPDLAMAIAEDLISDNEYRSVRAEVDENGPGGSHEEAPEVTEEMRSLCGEISFIRHEVNGMFGYDYDPALVAFKERQLFIKECQLEAARNGKPFSNERAYGLIDLATELSKEILRQLDSKANKTAYGGPQAFVSLDNGRSIEVTLEQEGLAESEQFYRGLLHCTVVELFNHDYQSTAGIVEERCSEDLDKEMLPDLLLCLLAANEMQPVAEQSLQGREEGSPTKKPSLSEQIQSASGRKPTPQPAVPARSKGAGKPDNVCINHICR